MKVLLTGSTGYIGRRLKQKLLDDETVDLKLLVRNKKSISPTILDKVEVIEGDTFNKDALKEAKRKKEFLESVWFYNIVSIFFNFYFFIYKFGLFRTFILFHFPIKRYYLCQIF